MFKRFFWLLVVDVIILGYVGGAPISPSRIALGQAAAAYYFLHFLVSVDNQKTLGKDNIAIPTTIGAESAVVDPQLQTVIAARAKASFVQLYLDQATTPALGAAINDATSSLILGTSTPEQTCQAITDAAKS